MLTDARERKVTFKKRRIGIIKKAIQLSKLTGAVVEIKIYNKEDGSLVELASESQYQLQDIERESKDVKQYCRFDSSHFPIVQNIEQNVTKHGHPYKVMEDFKKEKNQDLETLLSSIEFYQLFSMTKKMPDQIR